MIWRTVSTYVRLGRPDGTKSAIFLIETKVITLKHLRDDIIAVMSRPKKLYLIPAIVLFLIVLGLGVDYIRYKSGARSVFFGSLTTYKQSQTLHIEDLDVKVTAINRVNYKGTCDELPPKPTTSVKIKPSPLSDELIDSNSGPGWRENCKSGSATGSNDISKRLTEIKTGVVKLEIKNISNKTISPSDYSFTLHGPEAKDRPFGIAQHVIPAELDENDGRNVELTGGATDTFTVMADMDVQYNGSFYLEVKYDGVTKRINLATP